MTESLQEIERLSMVLGITLGHLHDDNSPELLRILQHIAERDVRIAVLEKALREYGKHKSGCYDKRQVVPRCVCGLNTALASRDAP